MIFIRAFVLLIGPLLLSLLAAAGSVVLVEGSASIQRGGSVLKVARGAGVEAGDMIVTGAGAKVKVRFEDGTMVTVGKNSQLNINDFINTGDERSKMEVGVVKGFFKAVTGSIGKVAPSRFKIKTSTTTIGIRGTTIVGETTASGDRVLCSSGAISVLSNMTGVQVIVQEGRITQIIPGQNPTQPRPYTPEEFNALDPDTQGRVSIFPAEGGDTEGETVRSTRSSIQQTADALTDLELLDLLDEQIDTLTSEKSSIDIDDLIDQDLIPDEESSADLGAYTISSDPYTSWGYWVEKTNGEVILTADKVSDVWFDGTATPTSYIDSLISGTSTSDFTFSGTNVFGVAGGEFIDSGSVQLRFQFGGDSAAFVPSDSYLQFSAGSDTWRVENLSGTVGASGFSSSDFTTGSGSTVSDVSGSVKGSFLGSEADEVAGKFDLTGGGKSAVGGFTAER